MNSLPFKRIGFFHFTSNFAHPLAELRKELKKHAPEDLAGSLIVLPEAFNLTRRYSSCSARAREAASVQDTICNDDIIAPGELRAQLRDLSGESTFIVSVLENRRNSAYLLSKGDELLLCHKMGDDGKHLCDPHPAEGADPRNPHDSIVTLICMDAYETGEKGAMAQRRAALLSQTPLCICSPQRNTRYEKASVSYKGAWQVFANGSDHPRCPSMIVSPDGVIVQEEDGTNRVGLHLI